MCTPFASGALAEQVTVAFDLAPGPGTDAWGALPATEAGWARSAYSHGRRLFRKCDAKIDGQRPAVPRPDHDRVAPSGVRSEERRVGKECRSRWSPYH